MTGKIKTLVADRGFGFITDGTTRKDIFFHLSKLKDVDFDELEVGDEVEYEETTTEKGKAAINVRRIGDRS